MDDQTNVSFRKYPLDIDLIYAKLGGFGKFQIRSYICLCLPLTLILCSNFSYIFIASDLEYRCLIPEYDYFDNITNRCVTEAIPFKNGKMSNCEKFSVITSNDTKDLECPRTFDKTDVVPCTEFVYLTDEINLVNEFNITCEENEWKLTMVGSLGYLSECFAIPFVGYIADKCGRRKTLIFTYLFAAIFGLAKSFSPDYSTFLTLHIIGAFCGSGSYALTFVYGNEIVGVGSRELGSSFITNAIAIAQIMLAILAMSINDFRILLQVIYGLLIITLPFFIWFVPESARWLLSQGKHRAGFNILKKVSIMNGTKISTEILNEITNHSNDIRLFQSDEIKHDRYPMRTALRTRKLLMRFINCCFCYFTNALIFKGLSVYSSILPGNKHQNLLYAALVEIPGNPGAYFILQRFGRRWALICSTLLCSISCICLEFSSNNQLKLTLFLIGKFAITVSFTVLHIYLTELFPTNIRQTMFNCCKTFAAFGNILAPQLPLLANIMPTLPLISFGGISFTTAVIIFLMPETRNKSLPETVTEAVSI